MPIQAVVAVPESASRRVYDYLRDQLLARGIAPNELLSEGQIAAQVGVSRTPVREALLRLEAEGFVRLLPKRGALVLPVTLPQVTDLIEARQLVETYAARKAIASGNTGPLLRSLSAQLSTMRSAMRTKHTRAYVEADRAFHAAIVAATDNEILIGLYRSLRDRQLRMGVVNLLDESDVSSEDARMRATIADHEAIASAIADGSSRAADAAIRAHLKHAVQLLERR
jgi:DNA-binding GntR family transcriptional regulator